jgi:hypothetical protein
MDYQIKMSIEAVHAANHLLTNTSAEGSRVETRCHSRCVRALKRDCMEERKKQTPEGDEETVEIRIKGNTLWSLPEDHFKYLKSSLDKMFKKSIPGTMTIGYDDLGDAVEEADTNGVKKDAVEAAQKAANA